MQTVGFIGIGVMGKSMAGHILDAGYPLHVYNRTAAKAQPLVAKGAVLAASPKQVAQSCDIVFTMLGFPTDVEDTYFNEEYGLLHFHKPGAVLVDCTTSTPTLAVKIAQAAGKTGALVLDAPVTGGDVGARNATLTMMCGGEEEAFEKCGPLLQLMAASVSLMGGAGSGQHAKMCNQIAIASGMLGVCEAIAYAQKSGLSAEQVLGCISKGAAGSWSLSNYGPRILNGDFEPGFYIKHFIKDMKIAIDEANRLGLNLPGLHLAEKLYEELQAGGLGDKGTQALYLWYAGQQQN